MRVLVTGGRDFCDREFVFCELDRLHAAHGFTVLVHGLSRGVDIIADDWAFENSVETHVVAAEWEKYGRAAGPIRNKAMLGTKPDLVVAFPGGAGTADMMRQAKRAGVDVVQLRPWWHSRRKE